MNCATREALLMSRACKAQDHGVILCPCPTLKCPEALLHTWLC